jgi:hypothetical protein
MLQRLSGQGRSQPRVALLVNTGFITYHLTSYHTASFLVFMSISTESGVLFTISGAHRL